MDRFAMPDDSIDSREVGSCEGCGGVVCAYEATTCPSCDVPIHKGCQKACHVCRSVGCRSCLSQDEDSLDWSCENCMVEKLERED